ncbi:MAG: glycosyltransferase family 4 protein [Thermoguttaceae bacterium]|nr:glycosyltransferase family 4 protein [Thermoguttaceae bacterium]
MRPLRVCCVALHAYPAIEPSAEGAFGGTETRAWTLARGLARQEGIEVRFLVRSRPPGWWILHSVASDVERIERFPWFRVRRWTASLLWKAPVAAAVRLLPGQRDPRRPDRFYQRIESDVFCCFGVHRDSATVIASARAAGRKTVLFLGADSDLDGRFTPDSTYRTPYGERGHVCWYALRHADRIVVQTEAQRRMLADRFGREGVLVPNPIDLAAWEAAQDAGTALPEVDRMAPYALWIGRADAFHKRPLLALELARRCPEVRFLMIVARRDWKIHDQLRRDCPANVRIIEPVPFCEMPLVFRGAAVYVNTSAPGYEGFPNVFLQAAASGVPIASLELDCGFVEAGRGGLAAGGDLDRLAEYVRAVWHDPQRRCREGACGRQYVRQHHDLPALAARVAELLRETCGRA